MTRARIQGAMGDGRSASDAHGSSITHVVSELSIDLEDCQKCLLRNLHGSNLLHALLTFLLLLQQLALSRDVAAVALREHVLPQRLHRRARDHLVPDRSLD